MNNTLQKRHYSQDSEGRGILLKSNSRGRVGRRGLARGGRRAALVTLEGRVWQNVVESNVKVLKR